MPATVLIVEDEPAILELIAVNLEHAGFETLRAKSGEEAGRLLGDILPDLVLLDWMLPGQSGLALARRLRQGLSPSGHDSLIETVRGSGYALRAESSLAAAAMSRA